MRNATISASAILWASAFVLAALVIVMAGRLPESPASAGMATTGTGGYTLVTASDGLGPTTQPFELLFVIDNQTQMLFVYTIENAADRRMLLRGGASLPNLFRTGRGG
ncbi:MAG: hypothetical protein SGJ09_15280 [Phycisphaerae bacterium]|nr:hypothetical protein [Phycisphaerae bacterium]